MGRLPNGATLPIRNLPSPVFRAETEKKPPPYYMEWVSTRIHRSMGTIARYFTDLARTVEEYAGESMESPTGETVLTVQPEWDPATENITSVLVTGPPSTAFTLQLGGRYLELVTDASGKVLLSPVLFKLKPSDQRILTSSTAGSWFIQMSGYVPAYNENM